MRYNKGLMIVVMKKDRMWRKRRKSHRNNQREKKNILEDIATGIPRR